MLKFLKNHPFAVEAFFESSVVLTFALPKEQLQSLIPEKLELDTLNDQYAFLAVAMVQTKALRPKEFPRILGHDFFLIGYRIFVKYHNKKGKRLRGLYIIKSETDKKKMALLGNIFTHYNYNKIAIEKHQHGNQTQITSKKSNFDIRFTAEEAEVQLPANSPFQDWKEARKYAGPLPFTFSYDVEQEEMLIIEGVRQNWTPKPITVISYQVDLLKKLQLEDAILANAFIIENIPYYWKKGEIEKWNK
ncbi:DUF2071 domain-containing protein [Sphingobacterium sp. SRCM116780]|uniref:DUF2071 domain-containing protein n=1 Tax=Sphingobacterium sp. SRCM116780 TaxID=2907623 RepID=UPI001F294804|nr:DUF2071 domain-containing protein [Sphingobacterium sp. SRCM116780]UIR56919.1 DUF2071 domain-containing protein [Sphingobacterium sp. SRCM116780]